MDQNTLIQAAQLEKQSEEMQQHLALIEQYLAELSQLKENIKHINKSSEKEILAQLGKGIYAKTSLIEKELFVNVGAGVVLKKTPDQTIKIIENQLKNLHEARLHLTAQIEIANNQLISLLQEIESSNKKG